MGERRCPIMNTQFFVNMFEMFFNRTFTNVQCERNLGIFFPLRDPE